MDNRLGFCKCGCGMKTMISKRTNKPNNFVKYHNLKGKDSINWKGGLSQGYRVRWNGKRPVKLHRELVEQFLKTKLPEKSVVHHINGNRSDNDPKNFVICEDDGYHHLLHHRERAFRACGHANYRRCWLCREWDDPKNLYINPSNCNAYHRACWKIYRK